MDNHYFDTDSGAYTMSFPADPTALPPDNGTFTPPPEAPAGYWPVINAVKDGWDLAEDHRGREGWLDGEWKRIEKVGPLPDGWSDTPPEPVEELPRSPEEQRRAAYVTSADPLFQQYQFYQAEADGWQALGVPEKSAWAAALADDYLRQYVLKKAEIREKYPDES